MISLSWNSSFEPNSYDSDKVITGLMERYRALPRHIARKHIGAAMRRILKPGIPILRRNTPPVGLKRGRRKAGQKARSTGALRRAVTVRVGQTGKNNDFNSFVYGVLGYKASFESRKAIWLQFGTSGGVKAYQMMEKTLQEFGPVAAETLARELAAAFEKAVAESGSGKNPPR